MAHGETYEEFVEKFKPKHTTDDCFTPALVYDAIADWVAKEYGLNRADFVRPFWPGGDYERFEYKDGCVVVDNPPFSILSKIITFYLERNIRFFLFAPALTVMNSAAASLRSNFSCTCVCTGAGIIYENGANVSTSFVTNLEDQSIRARSAPELTALILKAVAEYRSLSVKSVPKYRYPDNVVTAAMLNYMSLHGVDYSFTVGDSHMICVLDEQRKQKKAVFGGGFLLSEKAAAEKAAAEKAAADAAEKAAAIVWPLSDREKAIIAQLGA